jgi:hypothetical protein
MFSAIPAEHSPTGALIFNSFFFTLSADASIKDSPHTVIEQQSRMRWQGPMNSRVISSGPEHISDEIYHQFSGSS